MNLLRVLPLLALLACANKTQGLEEATWAQPQAATQVRLELIDTLLDSGRTPQALQLVALLREEGVDDPRLDMFQGRALAMEGMHTEAQALLESARKRMKRDPRPVRELALLYADTGQTDLAIMELQAALELDDTHAATWNNLGFLLFSSKRHDEAIPALQKAISLDGTETRYRNNLAYALAAQGRPQEALKAFMSVHPPAEAHANLAHALEMLGNDDRALEHYQRALQYNPDHTGAQASAARLAANRKEVAP